MTAEAATRQTVTRALLVSAGRIGFVALWFAAVMLIYSGLGRHADGLAQAGVFALAIACIKAASGFISDPMDLAIMGAMPPRWSADPAAALDVLRAALLLRLGALLVTVLPMLTFAPMIASAVTTVSDGPAIVRWVALAIVGDTLFRSTLVVQQAQERFIAFVLLEGLLQIGRTAVIGALWALDAMQVERVLLCYALASLGAAAVGALLLPRGLVRPAAALRRNMAGLVGYVRWMAPAMMLAALNERLDVFLVYSFRGSDAAGLYGGVLALALVPDILGGCLSTVLQPRIVRMQRAGQVRGEFRRLLLLSVPLCAAGMLCAWMLAGTVLPLLLGAKYAPAVPVFLWLLAGTLVWLAVTPVPLTLVAVLAPGHTLALTVLQSVMVSAGGLLLLPSGGALGMAQGIFATRVATTLALCAVAHVLTSPARARPAAELAGPA